MNYHQSKIDLRLQYNTQNILVTILGTIIRKVHTYVTESTFQKMSLEPRPEVTAAATAMVVQASIGLTILTFAFGVEIAGIYQRWRKINFWRRRQDRIILWLMGLTIVTFSYYLDQLFMFAKDWTGDENGCIIAAPRIPHFFAIAKQFLYYFLFERSRVVHTSLMITSRRFIYFREFIGLIIIFGLA